MIVGDVYHCRQHSSRCHICGYVGNRIFDGELLLAYDIRQYHSRAISSHTRPGACHVAVLWHKDYVYAYQYDAAYAREQRAPYCLVGKFVPERQVEVYSHHYLSCHNDWHYAKSRPVVRGYYVFEHIHIRHHCEESQQGEDYEVLHGLRIGVAAVLVFRLAEDKRFVGISECLHYHSHYHCYLACCPVDAQLGMGVITFIYIREQYFVCCLVQYSGYSQYKYRPGISQHLP